MYVQGKIKIRCISYSFFISPGAKKGDQKVTSKCRHESELHFLQILQMLCSLTIYFQIPTTNNMTPFKYPNIKVSTLRITAETQIPRYRFM